PCRAPLKAETGTFPKVAHFWESYVRPNTKAFPPIVRRSGRRAVFWPSAFEPASIGRRNGPCRLRAHTVIGLLLSCHARPSSGACTVAPFRQASRACRGRMPRTKACYAERIGITLLCRSPTFGWSPIRQSREPMQQIADWLNTLGLGQYAQRF